MRAGKRWEYVRRMPSMKEGEPDYQEADCREFREKRRTEQCMYGEDDWVIPRRTSSNSQLNSPLHAGTNTQLRTSSSSSNLKVW